MSHICKINGRELPIKEWFFVDNGVYLKFTDTTYDSVDKFIPKDEIITNIIIIKDEGTIDKKEDNYSVYLDRKSLTSEEVMVNVMEQSKDNVNIVKSVPMTIYSVSLGKPYIDNDVKAIKDYIGYVSNPEELSLEDYKKYSIKLSKDELENYLFNNPLRSNVHGNEYKLYSITGNKQILLLMELSCAKEAEEASIPYQPSWNASGESCTYDWTIDELRRLAFEINAIVKQLVSYQQKLEEQINEKISIEEIKEIEFDFRSSDPRYKVAE